MKVRAKAMKAPGEKLMDQAKTFHGKEFLKGSDVEFLALGEYTM